MSSFVDGFKKSLELVMHPPGVSSFMSQEGASLVHIGNSSRTWLWRLSSSGVIVSGSQVVGLAGSCRCESNSKGDALSRRSFDAISNRSFDALWGGSFDALWSESLDAAPSTSSNAILSRSFDAVWSVSFDAAPSTSSDAILGRSFDALSIWQASPWFSKRSVGSSKQLLPQASSSRTSALFGSVTASCKWTNSASTLNDRMYRQFTSSKGVNLLPQLPYMDEQKRNSPHWWRRLRLTRWRKGENEYRQRDDDFSKLRLTSSGGCSLHCDLVSRRSFLCKQTVGYRLMEEGPQSNMQEEHVQSHLPWRRAFHLWQA